MRNAVLVALAAILGACGVPGGGCPLDGGSPCTAGASCSLGEAGAGLCAVNGAVTWCVPPCQPDPSSPLGTISQDSYCYTGGDLSRPGLDYRLCTPPGQTPLSTATQPCPSGWSCIAPDSRQPRAGACVPCS